MNKDKKQMLVLGVLALVIIAVGAFQFLGGKSTPAPVAESSDDKIETEGELIAKGEEEEDPFDKIFPLDPLDKRDPFKPEAVIVEDPKPGDNDPKPTTTGTTRPSPQTTGSIPVPPFGNGNTGPGGPGVFPGNTENIVGGRAAGEPPFDIAGIIEGSRSTMAILSPDDGSQKIVSVGDKFGGMEIVAISSDAVEVIYKGKTRTLNFRGGN